MKDLDFNALSHVSGGGPNGSVPEQPKTVQPIVPTKPGDSGGRVSSNYGPVPVGTYWNGVGTVGGVIGGNTGGGGAPSKLDDNPGDIDIGAFR